MKQLIFGFLASLMLLLVSCAEKDYTTINEKIDRDGMEATFSQEEYNDMIEFVDKNMEKIMKVTGEKLNSLNDQFMAGDDSLSDSNKDEYKKLAQDANRMENYMMILENAKEEGKLDSSTEKKEEQVYEEYKRLLNKYLDVDVSNF